VVSYTSAHITETVFAHMMTNIERIKAIYLHHSSIIMCKSTENGYPYSNALHNRY